MMETIVMLILVNTYHINLANKKLSKSSNRIYCWEYRNIQGYSTVFLSQKYNQSGNFLPMENSSGMTLFYHASAVILSIIHSMAVMEMQKCHTDIFLNIMRFLDRTQNNLKTDINYMEINLWAWHKSRPECSWKH